MKNMSLSGRALGLALVVTLVGAGNLRADYPATILADSPTLYYRLSESPISFAVATNLGSAGTLGDGQYQHQVGYGSGGALVGDTDPSTTFMAPARVEAPYSAALNPNSPFTIECWTIITNAGPLNVYRSPVSSRDSGTGLSRGYILYVNNVNRWTFWTGAGTAWTTADGPLASSNVWVHLVGTRDAAGVNRLYVNGLLGASKTNAAFAPNDSRPFRIGCGANELLQGDYYFPGRVDEVAFYPTALSEAEVREHYANGTNANRATPYPQMVAAHGAAGYWRMNEAGIPPTVATNIGAAGAAGNGIYVGSTTTLEPGQTSATVDPDPAMGFAAGGTTAATAYGGRVDVPWSAAQNPANFTVEAWAYVPALYRDYQAIVASRDVASSVTKGFIIYARKSNSRFEFWTGRLATYNIASATNTIQLDAMPYRNSTKPRLKLGRWHDA